MAAACPGTGAAQRHRAHSHRADRPRAARPDHRHRAGCKPQLGRELGNEEARVLVDAAERFATVFGAIQAAAAEELVRERSRELEWLANTDALTGLYNLRYLQQHIRHLVGIQQRYGHAFAVLVLDINGLKRINDAHGHAAGDRMLMGVAAAVRATVRTIDTPVRM